MAGASLNREILRLAVPALGALVAEPAFLLVDAALVGHLGTAPLAGLGVASSVLQTIVGLMIFLAYSTTPAVARRFGAGDRAGAISVGIDGISLALIIGALLAPAGYLSSKWFVGLLGADGEVAEQAHTYLSISMWGLPAMLVVFAATGLLRGMQDTVTPLWIVGCGFSVNAALNALFIYGFGWGIAGSALGTVVAQWAMATAYIPVVVGLARTHRARFGTGIAGLGGSARTGAWMLLRSVSMRIALLATIAVATDMGTEELAGWQVVFTIFSATAFALDALAIAAQALIGKSLGAADAPAARAVLARTVAWGVWFGVALGIAIAALSGVIGLVFTGDRELAALISPALIVLAISLPVGAIVFALDGVLMGADDGRYLALAGAINLVIYLPTLAVIARAGLTGRPALLWLAIAFFGVYMLARLATLGQRIRTGRWLALAA